MVSRIQEWAAEQWFNGPQGGTPITKDRLNRIEEQVEGLTEDMNDLEGGTEHNHSGDYIPTTEDVTAIVKISSADYDALDPVIETTLYVVVDDVVVL